MAYPLDVNSFAHVNDLKAIICLKNQRVVWKAKG